MKHRFLTLREGSRLLFNDDRDIRLSTPVETLTVSERCQVSGGVDKRVQVAGRHRWPQTGVSKHEGAARNP